MLLKSRSNQEGTCDSNAEKSAKPPEFSLALTVAVSPNAFTPPKGSSGDSAALFGGGGRVGSDIAGALFGGGGRLGGGGLLGGPPLFLGGKAGVGESFSPGLGTKAGGASSPNPGEAS